MNAENAHNPYHDYQKARQLARQFEAMFAKTSTCFFSVDNLECLLDYYQQHEIDNKKSLLVLDYAIQQYPYSSQFHLKKVQLLVEDSQYQKALKYLHSCPILLTDNNEVAALEADIYCGLGRYSLALQKLRCLLLRSHSNEKSDVYLFTADLFDNLGHPTKAYRFIKRSLKITPCHEGALERMAGLVSELGKQDEAIRIYRHLLDENPYCHLVWYNLGTAYMEIGLYEKAIDAYEFVPAILEDDEDAYRNIAICYMALESYKLAENYFLLAMEYGEPDDEIWLLLGRCAMALGNYQQAIQYAYKAELLATEPEEALFLQAQAYEKEFAYTTALKYCKKTLQIQPDNVQYLDYLAQLYTKTGLHKQVEDVYTQIVAIQPQNFQAWYNLAFWHYDFYNWQTCYQVIQKAMLVNNKLSADLLYLLAACCYRLNKALEGYEYLHDALSLNCHKYTLFFSLIPHLQHNSSIMSLIEEYLVCG